MQWVETLWVIMAVLLDVSIKSINLLVLSLFHKQIRLLRQTRSVATLLEGKVVLLIFLKCQRYVQEFFKRETYSSSFGLMFHTEFGILKLRYSVC